MTRCPRGVLRWLSMLLMAGTVTAVPAVPVIAQDGATPAEDGTPPPVDLAGVPLRPSDMPKPGFQMYNAASLDYNAFTSRAFGVDATMASDGIDGADFQDGYFSMLALPRNLARFDFEMLAALRTTIVETVSEDSASELAGALRMLLNLPPSTSVQSNTAVVQEGNHVLWISYESYESSEGLSPEAMVEVAHLTTQRLRDTVAMAERGAPALGLGNVVFGGDSQGFSDRLSFSSDEFYRVLDGEVLSSWRDVETPSAPELAAGLTNVYIAAPSIPAPEDSAVRALVHVRITLAEFESAAAAAAFAAAPTDIVPTFWQLRDAIGMSYEAATDAGAGVAVSRGTVNDPDALRRTGFRAVRQIDRQVIVVELVTSAFITIPESSATWLMEIQTSCLRALPEPCAPVPLTDFDAAVEFRVPPAATPVATPDNANPATPVSGSPVPSNHRHGVMRYSLPTGDAVDRCLSPTRSASC